MANTRVYSAGKGFRGWAESFQPPSKSLPFDPDGLVVWETLLIAHMGWCPSARSQQEHTCSITSSVHDPLQQGRTHTMGNHGCLSERMVTSTVGVG